MKALIVYCDDESIVKYFLLTQTSYLMIIILSGSMGIKLNAYLSTKKNLINT